MQIIFLEDFLLLLIFIIFFVIIYKIVYYYNINNNKYNINKIKKMHITEDFLINHNNFP
jgi:hypothetical protein